MSPDTLTPHEARRITLAAQGLAQPRPSGRVDVRHLRRTIRQLGLLQLDFVNVLVPAHYQVLFSRLGPYDRSRLDDLVYRDREFTEAWAHQASIVPSEAWPLLHPRVDTSDRRSRALEAFMEQYGRYAERVVAEVRQRGPLTAGEIPELPGTPDRERDSWGWTPAKIALEAQLARGKLAVASRRRDFARVYDLAERVVPGEHFRRDMDRGEAKRRLLRQAAESLGLGTAADLADYFRMPLREAQSGLAELVEAGELEEVSVDGWRKPAYRHPAAGVPRRLEGSALLSPFDPLVWNRRRLARLFDFEYRVEIFVSPKKRRWGGYVLPFLLGDRLVARVDLKADRDGLRLLVLASYIEPDSEPGSVAAALAAELRLMASWLNLDTIVVEAEGDFARPLAAAVDA